MTQTKTVILSYDQLPTTIDLSDENESLSDTNIICGYCRRILGETAVYVYSSLESDDFWYLCEKCFHSQIKFCQYTNKFFPHTELVQLITSDSNCELVVYQGLTDFIETYQMLPNSIEREKYLDMNGITQNISISLAKLSTIRSG